MLCKIVLILAVALAAPGCNRDVPNLELVAKVNGRDITKAEFEAAAERTMARYRDQGHTLPPGIEQRIKESALRRLINEAVIRQTAESIGVTVSAEELESKFQQYKKRFPTDQAFQDYLERAKNSEENMRRDLRRNLLRDRVVEKLSGTIDVTDEEISKYYTDNMQRFVEKEQIRASRVLIRVNSNATDDERKKLEAEADGVLKELDAAGADFGEIARASSRGPEAARRGELGWLIRGRMPSEFDAVAFGLEANQMSDVIETELGYEIVKVFEKKPERQRTLEEVEDNIKSSLMANKRNEKRREVLLDLKKNTKVEQLIKLDRPQPSAASGPDDHSASEQKSR